MYTIYIYTQLSRERKTTRRESEAADLTGRKVATVRHVGKFSRRRKRRLYNIHTRVVPPVEWRLPHPSVYLNELISLSPPVFRAAPFSPILPASRPTPPATIPLSSVRPATACVPLNRDRSERRRSFYYSLMHIYARASVPLYTFGFISFFPFYIRFDDGDDDGTQVPTNTFGKTNHYSFKTVTYYGRTRNRKNPNQP